MKPAAFSYCRARSSAEAIALIHEAGDNARFLAGGQSLVPMMNFRIARPNVLVDLGACDDLDYLRGDGDQLRIGAMTRQWDAQTNALVLEHLPVLAKALSHAGPETVRNRGTIGGSIANAYPLAELPCLAVALEARIVLESAAGTRTLAADEFFVSALSTSMRPGELLREVVFPCRLPHRRYAFFEAGNHAGGAALAIVCAYADLGVDGRLKQVRIAAAGIESKSVRLPQVEQAVLEGIDDLAPAYRRDLAAQSHGVSEEADTASDLVGALLTDAARALRRDTL